jgi:hypothetical protein
VSEVGQDIACPHLERAPAVNDWPLASNWPPHIYEFPASMKTIVRGVFIYFAFAVFFKIKKVEDKFMFLPNIFGEAFLS